MHSARQTSEDTTQWSAADMRKEVNTVGGALNHRQIVNSPLHQVLVQVSRHHYVPTAVVSHHLMQVSIEAPHRATASPL